MATSRPFGFISAKLVMGYPCMSPYILFYIHGRLFCFVYELRKNHKITQIQNSG